LRFRDANSNPHKAIGLLVYDGDVSEEMIEVLNSNVLSWLMFIPHLGGL
jgi:hypothetical protein